MSEKELHGAAKKSAGKKKAKKIMSEPEIDTQIDTRLDVSSGVEREACGTIWNCVAGVLRGRIGEGAFDRWFSHVSLDRIESGAVCLIAPNSMYQVWIEENFRNDLHFSLAQFLKNCPPAVLLVDEERIVSQLGGSPTEGRDCAAPGAGGIFRESGKTTNLRLSAGSANLPKVAPNDAATDSRVEGGDKTELESAARNQSNSKSGRNSKADIMEVNGAGYVAEMGTAVQPSLDGFLASPGENDHQSNAELAASYDPLLLRGPVEPMATAELLRRGRLIGLSDRYWMDGFVVGDNNQLSHAAALAVIDKPSQRYNPLFLYSAPGLGKSHLLHAIGWEMLRKNPRVRIAIVSGEAFANEFIAALHKHSLVAFRKKYRKVDVLLMDDIQFLAGKDATQEEFFHTFNTLMDDRRQMVLTSDAAPSEIPALEARLVSRFHWGMSAEMQEPQLEARMAILQRKRQDWKVELPDWVIEYIAERIRSSVRLMEGALMRAATLKSLNSTELTEEVLGAILADFRIEDDSRDVSIEAILDIVAEQFDMNVRDLTGRRRTARISHARQVAMWLARKLTTCSLQEIGLQFGGRDHGTILHGVRTIDRKAAEDSALGRQNDFLKRQLTRNASRRRDGRRKR